MLTLLVALEPEQEQWLDVVCAGALISEAELIAEGAIGKRGSSQAANGSADDKQIAMF